MCCKCQLSNLFPACAPVCSSCTVHCSQCSLFSSLAPGCELLFPPDISSPHLTEAGPGSPGPHPALAGLGHTSRLSRNNCCGGRELRAGAVRLEQAGSGCGQLRGEVRGAILAPAITSQCRHGCWVPPPRHWPPSWLRVIPETRAAQEQSVTNDWEVSTLQLSVQVRTLQLSVQVNITYLQRGSLMTPGYDVSVYSS